MKIREGRGTVFEKAKKEEEEEKKRKKSVWSQFWLFSLFYPPCFFFFLTFLALFYHLAFKLFSSSLFSSLTHHSRWTLSNDLNLLLCSLSSWLYYFIIWNVPTLKNNVLLGNKMRMTKKTPYVFWCNLMSFIACHVEMSSTDWRDNQETTLSYFFETSIFSLVTEKVHV